MVDKNIRPGGREVELCNDHVFREIRKNSQVPNDFVNDGWNLETLQKGGGKGGTLMALIKDEYIVKELSPPDHMVLLKIAQSYQNHVQDNETLLTPIYIHFLDRASGRFFFAMKNTIGNPPYVALYDLKGCADDKTMVENGVRVKDVHKRIWNIGMWCGTKNWTADRRKYYDGKLAASRLTVPVAEDVRLKLLACIKRDSAWCVSHKLMDYSLLVCLKEDKTNGGQSLHISIIDFLQKWTTGKKIARCIKACEQNKATVPPRIYAKRFCSQFEHVLVPVEVGLAPPIHFAI